MNILSLANLINFSIILAFFGIIFYLFFYSNNEYMTNMEAASILPVLYDSSLTNKNKITDLLGITVNDDTYNEILNTKNNDADAIISSIKEYIGSSVVFTTPSDDTVDKVKEKAVKPLALTVDDTSAPSDSTTTKPTTLAITQVPFKDRI